MSSDPGLRLIRWSMAIALGLAALKALAGCRSGSLAIVASALDSVMDFGSSWLNLISARVAASPPDEEHPFGRGKAECLAALLQGALIAGAAVALLAESARRLLRGSRVDAGPEAFAVMIVGGLVSVAHGWRLRRAARRADSLILEAESLHFATDVFANLGVIAALGIVRLTGNPDWDLAVFCLITVYLLAESSRIVRGAIAELMDRRLPREVHDTIAEIVLGHHPSVVGFHDLKTRKSGRRRFITLHIEIRGVREFERAHEITESLIDKIKARLPGSEVTIHYDPQGAR